MGWPVSDSEKKMWDLKKQCNALFHFKFDLINPVWKKIPSMQELFAVALSAKRIGYMNWIWASRTLALGDNSPRAAGALILLIGLEIISPADHWQKRHNIGQGIDAALIKMENEIKKKGFIHWLDETGVVFKNQLGDSKKRDLGWVAADHIKQFLEIMDGGEMFPEPPATREPLKDLSHDPDVEAPQAKQKVQSSKQLELPFRFFSYDQT